MAVALAAVALVQTQQLLGRAQQVKVTMVVQVHLMQPLDMAVAEAVQVLQVPLLLGLTTPELLALGVMD